MDKRKDLDESVWEQLRQIGGDALIEEILSLFLERVPDIIAEAQAGYAQSDYEVVERAVHSLKSSAGSIGAFALQDLCQQIEIHAAAKQGELIQPLVRQLEETYARVHPRIEAASHGQ